MKKKSLQICFDFEKIITLEGRVVDGVGISVGIVVGTTVGDLLGLVEGVEVKGCEVGSKEGLVVGSMVGPAEGEFVGWEMEGTFDGNKLGATVFNHDSVLISYSVNKLLSTKNWEISCSIFRASLKKI